MRLVRIAVLLLIAWYVLLIAAHYANQRPLWNDEACVFQSVRDFTPRQLFSQPLEAIQVFPRFYLWCIQSFGRHFNYSLLSLRLFSFLSMLAAFLVWMNIAGRRWQCGLGQLNFCLCWAASIPLIYYSAELKPYSMDVLAAAVFIWSVLRATDGKLNLWWLCLLPLFGLFSYAAFFLMVFPLYWLLRSPKPSSRRVLAVYAGVCLVMAWYLYSYDLRVSNMQYLRTQDWKEHFIALNSAKDFFNTLGKGLNNFTRWFVEQPKIYRMQARFFLWAGLVYVCWMGARQFMADRFQIKTVTVIAFGLFIEAFVLGLLQRYPFIVTRTSLYMAPALLFGLAEWISYLKQRWPAAYWPFQIAFWAYTIYCSLGISWDIFIHGDLGADVAIWIRH